MKKSVSYALLIIVILALSSCKGKQPVIDSKTDDNSESVAVTQDGTQYTNHYSWNYDEFAIQTGKNPEKLQFTVDLENSRKTDISDARPVDEIIYKGVKFEGYCFRHSYLSTDNHITTLYRGTGSCEGISIEIDDRNGEIISVSDYSLTSIKENASREKIDIEAAGNIAKEFLKDKIDVNKYVCEIGEPYEYTKDEYTVNSNCFTYSFMVNGITAEQYYVYVTDTGMISSYGKIGEYVENAGYPEFNGEKLLDSVKQGAQKIINESGISGKYETVISDFLCPFIVAVDNDTFMVISSVKVINTETEKNYTTFDVVTLFNND